MIDLVNISSMLNIIYFNAIIDIDNLNNYKLKKKKIVMMRIKSRLENKRIVNIYGRICANDGVKPKALYEFYITK